MEILTNLQQRILILFSSLSDQDAFYLTGGTALSAFFLKHRKSHDLDFFTSIEELIVPFSQKHKLLALFGRATLRDFIDVYFLSQEHFDKKELIAKAAQKDPGFDLYWLGIAMERINAFSDDSPDFHLLTRPCAMNELRKFFRAWRKEIINELKK